MQESGQWVASAAMGTKVGGASDTAAARSEMKGLLFLLFQCLLAGIFTPEAKSKHDNPKPGKHLALTCGLREATRGWRALCPTASVF